MTPAEARSTLSAFFRREPVRETDRVQLRHEGVRVVVCGDHGHSANIFDACQWCGGEAIPLREKPYWQRDSLDPSGVPVG